MVVNHLTYGGRGRGRSNSEIASISNKNAILFVNHFNVSLSNARRFVENADEFFRFLPTACKAGKPTFGTGFFKPLEMFEIFCAN